MIEELQRNICLVGINDLDARLFLECIERVTEDKANKKLKKNGINDCKVCIPLVVSIGLFCSRIVCFYTMEYIGSC